MGPVAPVREEPHPERPRPSRPGHSRTISTGLADYTLRAGHSQRRNRLSGDTPAKSIDGSVRLSVISRSKCGCSRDEVVLQSRHRSAEVCDAPLAHAAPPHSNRSGPLLMPCPCTCSSAGPGTRRAVRKARQAGFRSALPPRGLDPGRGDRRQPRPGVTGCRDLSRNKGPAGRPGCHVLPAAPLFSRSIGEILLPLRPAGRA